MRRRRLHGQLFPTYLTIILLSILVNGWLATRIIYRSHLKDLTAELKARAALVSAQLRQLPPTISPAGLDSICKNLGSLSSMRITLIDTSGRVLGDSHQNPATMENHSDRPEIRAALRDSFGEAIRISPTLKEKMLYVAVPLRNKGELVGTLRLAHPLSQVDLMLHPIYTSLALVGIFIVLSGAGLIYWVSWRFGRHLTEMADSARRFQQGDFGRRILIPETEELGTLAQVLNDMAEQLSARIGDVTRQRDELEALLSSMIEGVIAVDVEERIISANRAARAMLNISLEDYQGRFVQEAVGITHFHRFVGQILEGRQNLEEEMTWQGGRTIVAAHGTMLKDPEGRDRGVLIVLQDITRLKKLENLRKEFVANVSHELRTPVTTIKGYVETLQETQSQDPSQTASFLQIIARNADRLNSIIEDLLSLSRLEQGQERGDIQFEVGAMREVIAAAVQSCAPHAIQKNIQIQAEAQEGLSCNMNATLLEQALINLLENAIKYSPPDSLIKIKAGRVEQKAVLTVQDFGCGISEEHLPRIFERFYRVDKNRSRELGGTGLGLAIVKHIALIHRGTISVSSVPGQGSTFRLHLPLHPGPDS